MQAFVEQQIGTLGQIFPWRELAWAQLGAKACIQLGRFFIAVNVVTLLAAAALAIGFEQGGQRIKVVCLRAKVRKRLVACRFSLLHGGLEFGPTQTVEAIAFNNRSVEVFTLENMLKGTFNGCGARTGGTGHDNDWMLLRHTGFPLEQTKTEKIRYRCGSKSERQSNRSRNLKVCQYKRRSPKLSSKRYRYNQGHIQAHTFSLRRKP